MLPINARRLVRCAALSALMVLLCSCSRFVANQMSINRDAAARCVQNIGEWKKDLAKLDMLSEKFDFLSGQIRREYSKAAPEEKIRLRTRLRDVVQQTDNTAVEADALFNEILRDLEYVSRD